MSEFNPVSIDQFLTNEEVTAILSYAENTDVWIPYPDTIWDKRTITLDRIKPENSDVAEIIEKAALKTQQIIHEKYDLPYTPYADAMSLCRWFDGMAQSPHCDDMSNVEGENKIHGHREFGSIIYLNDDYDGGETYYPGHNFKIDPISGRIAIHLSDCNHRHGVTEIKGKTRYTIASFWTSDKKKATSSVNWKRVNGLEPSTFSLES